MHAQRGISTRDRGSDVDSCSITGDMTYVSLYPAITALAMINRLVYKQEAAHSNKDRSIRIDA